MDLITLAVHAVQATADLLAAVAICVFAYFRIRVALTRNRREREARRQRRSRGVVPSETVAGKSGMSVGTGHRSLARRVPGWILPSYVALVALGAAYLTARLYFTTRTAVDVRWIPDVWVAPLTGHDGQRELFLVWLLAILLFSWLRVDLPKGGATSTVAWVPDLAALFVFGPAGASFMVGLTDLITNVGKERIRILFNVAQTIVTVTVAGVFYELSGGSYGTDFTLTASAVPAVVVAAFTYFLVNSILVASAVSMAEGASLSQVWRSNHKKQLRSVLLLLLPAASVLAASQLHFGLLGAVLCCLPLLFVHIALKAQARERHDRFETIRMTLSAIDRTDPATVDHSRRIAAYAVSVATELGASTHDADDIELAALFHNLGTLSMKHEFLLKRRRLTPEEEQEVKRHVDIAYELLRDMPPLSKAAWILRCHHEQPNGKGYPDRLREGDIPDGSLVLQAVDAFDSMVVGRPHRQRPQGQKMSPEVALQKLRGGAGEEYSKKVVDALGRLYWSGRLTDELDEHFRQQQVSQLLSVQVGDWFGKKLCRLRTLFEFFAVKLDAWHADPAAPHMEQEKPSPSSRSTPRQRFEQRRSSNDQPQAEPDGDG